MCPHGSPTKGNAVQESTKEAQRQTTSLTRQLSSSGSNGIPGLFSSKKKGSNKKLKETIEIDEEGDEELPKS